MELILASKQQYVAIKETKRCLLKQRKLPKCNDIEYEYFLHDDRKMNKKIYDSLNQWQSFRQSYLCRDGHSQKYIIKQHQDNLLEYFQTQVKTRDQPQYTEIKPLSPDRIIVYLHKPPTTNQYKIHSQCIITSNARDFHTKNPSMTVKTENQAKILAVVGKLLQKGINWIFICRSKRRYRSSVNLTKYRIYFDGPSLLVRQQLELLGLDIVGGESFIVKVPTNYVQTDSTDRLNNTLTLTSVKKVSRFNQFTIFIVQTSSSLSYLDEYVKQVFSSCPPVVISINQSIQKSLLPVVILQLVTCIQIQSTEANLRQKIQALIEFDQIKQNNTDKSKSLIKFEDYLECIRAYNLLYERDMDKYGKIEFCYDKIARWSPVDHGIVQEILKIYSECIRGN